MTAWTFNNASAFTKPRSSANNIAMHGDSSDGVEGVYCREPKVIRKHGAFTLVQELGADLIASLSLLENLEPAARIRPFVGAEVNREKTAAPRTDFIIASQLGSFEQTTVQPHEGSQGFRLQWRKPLNPGSFWPTWPTKAVIKTRRGISRRAVFSDLQRQKLEDQFTLQKYISKPDRKKLAESLGLKDSQVKVWFQNRRMKWRNTKEREYLTSQQHFPGRHSIPDLEVRKYILD